jgi:hypothetical protein
MVYIGIFSNQKSQFGLILWGLAIEDVGLFYGLLVYFTAIWSILRPYGLFYGLLVYFVAIWYSLLQLGTYFPRFGMLYQEKSGNPALTDVLVARVMAHCSRERNSICTI